MTEGLRRISPFDDFRCPAAACRLGDPMDCETALRPMVRAKDAAAVGPMNDSAYGLTASIWTTGQATAMALGVSKGSGGNSCAQSPDRRVV